MFLIEALKGAKREKWTNQCLFSRLQIFLDWRVLLIYIKKSFIETIIIDI